MLQLRRAISDAVQAIRIDGVRAVHRPWRTDRMKL